MHNINNLQLSSLIFLLATRTLASQPLKVAFCLLTRIIEARYISGEWERNFPLFSSFPTYVSARE